MAAEVVKKEIRFSWHIPRSEYRPDDMHYVREDVTYSDGTVVPQTYLVKDYQRPVWVTKPSFRNHKDKLEFEHKDRLFSRKTAQSDLNRTVAQMLEMPHLATQASAIKDSPYVYGYDITSTSLIKYGSLKRNEFVQSPYSVAAFDIETNPDTDEILMATVAYRGKTYTGVLRKFLKNIPNPEERLQKAIARFLPKYAGMSAKLSIHENEVDLLKDVFRVANEWKPVFLTIWNMDFDVTKILACLKRHNVNPVDVICDQTLPRKYRMCRYRQGIKKKVMASGVVKPINPSLQWHTLVTTSTFYVIDSMCVFRQLRMAKAERQSYSLDAILKEELDTQKLRFKEAEGYSGVREHIFLQENYPIEYIVYNLYDCLSMLELDEKNKDLTSSLPSFAGITDFPKFNSQVRKITDALFLFGLDRDKVIGTAAKVKRKEDEVTEVDDELLAEDEDDEDDPTKYKTLDLKGWIQLLPQNLLLNQGLKCLEEYPDVVTNVRGISCDIDASSAYPSCTLTANVSKATCVNEFISVESVDEAIFRQQNLGICLGGANLLEYFTEMFDMPTLTEMNALLDTPEYHPLLSQTS